MNRQLRIGAAAAIVSTMLIIGGCVAGRSTAAGGEGGTQALGQSVAYLSTGERKDTAHSASHPLLAGTVWHLTAFQSMDDAIGTLRPDDPSRTVMRLEGDGTVTIHLDCHRIRGTWSAEPGGDGSSGRFAFGPVERTRGTCPTGRLDARIETDVTYIRSYLVKGGRLYLSLMADGGIYAWAPVAEDASAAGVPVASPEEGGPRNWEVTGVSSVLNLREAPSIAAGVVARFSSGTILDNLGCLQVDGRVWCDVQPLGGGPRGYVSAAYLKPAVSPDGSVATGSDDSALRAGSGRFDATGQIPCAQSDGQPMMQCEFGVARAGGGYATVVVKRPDGRTRAIFFRMGIPIGADTSQADGYPEFSTTRENDLHRIRVGEERYEIPDAAVLGG